MYFNGDKNNTNIDSNFSSNKNKKNILLIVTGIIFGFLIIFLILYFFLFKKEEVIQEYLVLEGNKDIVMYQWDEYVEPGYRAYDSNGNVYNDLVSVTGTVNSSIAGDYVIKYQFHDIVLERNISVLPEVSNVTYLILKGDNVIFIPIGGEYKEPGYTVIDSTNPNLTEQVKVDNNLNNNVVGTYKITYSVTNGQGDTVSAERTVIVTAVNANFSYTPNTITNKDVTISISSNDNYYDYTILPDGSKSSTRNVTYTVSKNGNYKFIIYSKDGTNKEENIEIKNIDKEEPTGSCSAVRKKGAYNIEVNAKDNVGIKEYKYYAADELINTSNKKSISYTSSIVDSISVIVNDMAGNSKKLSCSMSKVYDLEIHFINVGREDAILVRSNDATIFIDGGLYGNQKKLIPYINDLGVKKFDAIIGSHLHNNHIQAQGAILDNFEVTELYYPQDVINCVRDSYCVYADQKYIVEAIKKYNKTPKIMKSGDHIVIGDITIDCYGPIDFKKYNATSNPYAQNHNSLNFIITYGKNKFMFTGDHMQSSNLLKKFDSSLFKVDLLKYPHHGGDSIGKDLTYAMKPKYVISTSNTLNDLKGRLEYRYFKEFGSEIYYSGRDDNILVTSDGENITVKTKVTASSYKR